MAKNVEYSVGVIWTLLKRITLVVGATALSIYVLYKCRSIFVSVLIAVFLTYALLPGVEWLSRKKIKWMHPRTQRLLATTIVFILFFTLVTLSLKLILTPFKHQTDDLSKNWKTYSTQVTSWIDSTKAWYQAYVPEDVRAMVHNLYTDDSGKNNFADYLGFGGDTKGGALQNFFKQTRSWIGFALDILLIPVLAFYFVWDYRSITREIYSLMPKKRLHDAMRIGRDMGEIMQSYVIGQFILCLIAGVLTGLVLWWLKMPYALVLAILAGVTRAIPVIGPVVSGIPIILVALIHSNGHLGQPTALLAFVTIMHFAESKAIMPRLIGDRMHLHPAVVIIVLLIGAEFGGILGMFVAAPIAAIVRDLIRLYYVRPRERARRSMGMNEEKILVES